MEFRLLGPFEVVEGDARAVLGGPRHRMVLAMLALAAPEVVSTDRLVDGLWGESPPEKPLATLQVFVHKLRRGLADLGAVDPRQLLQSKAPGYRLAIDPATTDVGHFEELLRRADQLSGGGEARAVFDVLQEALALWRGPALADLRDAPFAEPEAVRLEELRLAAEENRADAALTLGRHAPMISHLEGLVRKHPTRERFWALLMTALYRADRQADALAAYGRARDTLADELGIDPGEALRQLEVGILRQDPTLAAPATLLEGHAVPTVRPREAARVPVPLTPTVGRDELVRTVLGRLTRPDVRVVTLTGLGGSGKSRVASLAAGLVTADTAGVCFLVVTEETSADQLLHEAALALTGRAGEDPLGDLAALGTDATGGAAGGPGTAAGAVIVLDNLESLPTGADLVHRLVSALPGLTVMVTSRVALGVPGEWEVPVPPLTVPDDRATAEQVAASPAVQLFVDRAEAADPAFTLAGQEPAVAALCRLLDGVPLALELAAARLSMFSVPQLTSTLGDGLDLLSTGSPGVPERHRSLAATIEWSHERLDPVAQRVCERLALFERGFTIEALEAVCDDVPHVLETLGDIVAARLVRPVDSRVEVRFVVLGTVRAFARQRLASHPDLDERRERLAAHLLDRLTSWGSDLDGPEGLLALGRFDDAAADVDASIEWSVARARPTLAADLATAATGLWVASGRLHEGSRMLARVRALSGLDATRSAALAAAAGWVAYQLTDWAAAVAVGSEALRTVDEDADATTAVIARCAVAGAQVMSGAVEEGATAAERALADALAADLYPWSAVASSTVAISCAVRGDFAGEQASYQQRLELVRRHGDMARTADTLNTLAEISLDEDDAESARVYARESLQLAEGRLPLEARDATITLARAEAALGDRAAASRRLREALALSDRTGQTLALAQCLRTGGLLVALGDRPGGAARLYAAAQALSPSPSGGDEPVERDFAAALDRARSHLGTAFAREWGLGRSLPLASARALLDEVLESGSGAGP